MAKCLFDAVCKHECQCVDEIAGDLNGQGPCRNAQNVLKPDSCLSRLSATDCQFRPSRLTRCRSFPFLCLPLKTHPPTSSPPPPQPPSFSIFLPHLRLPFDPCFPVLSAVLRRSFVFSFLVILVFLCPIFPRACVLQY